jgi:hypothetical protein
MSNGLIDTFLKGESGMFIKCSRCGCSILGGEDIFIPVEHDFNTPNSKEYILHNPVCVNCHSAMIAEWGVKQ